MPCFDHHQWALISNLLLKFLSLSVMKVFWRGAPNKMTVWLWRPSLLFDFLQDICIVKRPQQPTKIKIGKVKVKTCQTDKRPKEICFYQWIDSSVMIIDYNKEIEWIILNIVTHRNFQMSQSKSLRLNGLYAAIEGKSNLQTRFY